MRSAPYLLSLAVVLGCIFFAPARSSWGNESPSCIIQTNVHRVEVGKGCRAKRAYLPRGMRVTFR